MSNSEIEQICKKHSINNYTINNDGTIDVDGSVDLADRGLTKIPLKFNRVTGEFACFGNNLINLIGSPKYVDGLFDCDYCGLTSLEGCPEFIDKNFICESNKLTSLEHCPKEVGGDLYFYNSQITSLEGFDCEFKGKFYCKSNPIGSIFDEVDQDFTNWFKQLKIIKGDQVNLNRLKYLQTIFDFKINIEEIKKHYTVI